MDPDLDRQTNCPDCGFLWFPSQYLKPGHHRFLPHTSWFITHFTHYALPLGSIIRDLLALLLNEPQNIMFFIHIKPSCWTRFSVTSSIRKYYNFFALSPWRKRNDVYFQIICQPPRWSHTERFTVKFKMSALLTKVTAWNVQQELTLMARSLCYCCRF